MSESIPSLDELTALCREWQERLSLQDWRVRVRYSEKFELDGLQGRCQTEKFLKSAVIRINPHRERADADDDFSPIELVLIHELVHLHIDALWNFTHESTEHILVEQAIQCLARGMYRAKYQDKIEDTFLTPAD